MVVSQRTIRMFFIEVMWHYICLPISASSKDIITNLGKEYSLIMSYNVQRI